MKSQKNGAMLCSRSVPQHDKQKILVPLGNQKLEKINLQQPHYAMFWRIATFLGVSSTCQEKIQLLVPHWEIKN